MLLYDKYDYFIIKEILFFCSHIKVHEVSLRGIPWIKTKSLFTPKALEMSFALIIEIVWIMPSKITGNIGHA